MLTQNRTRMAEPHKASTPIVLGKFEKKKKGSETLQIQAVKKTVKT
jgi:hypothetical protein